MEDAVDIDKMIKSATRILKRYKKSMSSWYSHIDRLVESGTIIKNVTRIRCREDENDIYSDVDVSLYYMNNALYAIECPRCKRLSAIRIGANDNKCPICDFSMSSFEHDRGVFEVYQSLQSYE